MSSLTEIFWLLRKSRKLIILGTQFFREAGCSFKEDSSLVSSHLLKDFCWKGQTVEQMFLEPNSCCTWSSFWISIFRGKIGNGLWKGIRILFYVTLYDHDFTEKFIFSSSIIWCCLTSNLGAEMNILEDYLIYYIGKF